MVFYSAVNPGGIRLGTPALTTRGMMEEDMDKVADFLVKSVAIALRVQEKSGKKFVDFVSNIEGDEEMLEVGKQVQEFAR